MSERKQYIQCRMHRPAGPGATHSVETTGWIEARGAKVGAQVELLPSHAIWEVAEVFDGVKIPEDVLREDQRQKRKGLPSIRDTDKDKRQAAQL